MLRWMIVMLMMSLACTGAAGAADLPDSGYSWEPLVVEKLPNGITVVVKQVPTAPLAVTDIWFRVGSRNETDLTNGLAHFLEHTLFKGTPTRKVGQVALEIEGFGGRTNAGTSLDFTHYYISCESRNILKAMEIHADVFRNSTLLPEVIESERAVILEEVKRGEDDPRKETWNTLLAELFTQHPYRRPTIGTRENVAKHITAPVMREFFHQWYVPGNMSLVVVGDVDPAAVIAKAKALYGDLPAAIPPKAEFPVEPELKAPRIVRKEMDVDRQYLLLAYRTVPQSSREEAIGMDLLGVVLGSGRTSRLSLALKESKPLVTTISAGQLSLIDDGLFMVRAEFDPADEEEVLQGIREEIRKLVREAISAEELQKAKDYLENLYIRLVETNEGKAEALGSALLHGDLKDELEYLEKIRAVSASQLQILANKYLAGEGYGMVLIGPRPRYVEDLASATAAVSTAAVSTAAVSTAALAGPASGPATVPAAGAPANLGIRKFTMDNGLRVIHRHLPNTRLVGLSMAIDAGARQEPEEMTGISNLTAEMLFKGTRHRDGNQILWDLGSLGAEAEPSSEPDLLRITMSAPARGFGRAFAVLADVLRAPTFPAPEFEIERKKVQARLKAVSDNMFENTWRLFHRTMYPNHPYARYSLGEAEEVAKLTREDLEAFHRRCFQPRNMVLSVVGDLDASETLKLAYNYFGFHGTPGTADDASPATATPPVPPQAFRLVQETKEKKQAMLCLGWLGPQIGHPDYAAMKVLNAVLGGGMSARYFMNIRNKASLAYAVQGVFPSRMDRGSLCAVVGTDPGAVDKVKELVLNEAQDIITNGVPPAELDRAISYVTGQFALDHAASSRMAQYLAWFELIGSGYLYDLRFPEEVRRVTAEDLKRVAATYLDPARALMAVTGPAPAAGTR